MRLFLIQPVPVDRLVKCKMMENLEFLQWLKKYWDLNFPGGEYNALARRNGQGGAPREQPINPSPQGHAGC